MRSAVRDVLMKGFQLNDNFNTSNKKRTLKLGEV